CHFGSNSSKGNCLRRSRDMTKRASMKGENAMLDKVKHKLLQPGRNLRVQWDMKVALILAAILATLPGRVPGQSELSDLVNPFIPLATDRPRQSTEDRPGPWDQDVWVYRVRADGKIDPLVTFERAGVPTLA